MGARPLPADPLNGLLEPTLAAHVPRTGVDPRPWRVGSQIYVGILGGPIAVTIIALLNALRLRMPSRALALIGAVGVAAIALAVLLVSVLPEEARIGAQITGAAAAGLFYLLQRRHDRVYFAFSDEDDDLAYDSLWGPGVGAVIAGIVVMSAIAV